MATVLVVDDRAVGRALARTLLGYAGHTVLEAGNGLQALEIVAAQNPDVIVTDVLMPGMDGYELVRELRGTPRTARIPVIFHTANYLADEVSPMAQACGVPYVIAESADPQAFLDAVEAALATPPAASPLIPSEEFTWHHLRAVNSKLVQKTHELEIAHGALRESEARFRGMAESSPLGMMRLDSEHRASYANPRLAQILGAPVAAELLGDGWLQRISPDERARVLATVRHDGAAPDEGRDRVCVERIDGQRRWLDLYTSPLRGGEGAAAGSICLLDDVTALVEAAARQRETDERLRLAERMESLGRLAGCTAHDFNNLLAVVLSHTEIIRDGIHQEAEDGHLTARCADALYEDLDRIERAGARAARLSRQLLTFGRREATQVRLVDLNDVVAEAVGSLRSTLGDHIDLQVTAEPELRSALVDADQINQVLLNLAVNARDAMPGGGSIVIETANLELADDHGRPHSDLAPGQYVALTVRDAGQGMSPEVLRRAIEPFFTTKGPDSGTGLGLASVYGIIRQSGGDLDLESALGIGTVVRILLPAATAATARPAAAGSGPGPASAGGSETILVVEDRPEILVAAEQILSQAGYRAITCPTSEAALEAARASPVPIDLLVSDVVMPGISGPDLAERLAEHVPGLRVLYMSGYTADVIARGGMADADLVLLPKPFSEAELLRAVRLILDANPPAHLGSIAVCR